MEMVDPQEHGITRLGKIIVMIAAFVTAAVVIAVGFGIWMMVT